MEQYEDRRAELVDAFLTASRVLTGVAVRSIDAADPAVTVPQHRLLVLLAGHGPQQIGSLATGLNVNSSNATRQCDRLERKGLVTRTRSTEDRRTVVVGLTEQGRELVDTVTSVRRAEIAALVERMPAPAAAAALTALQAFSAAAEEPSDDHWRDRAASG